MKISHWVLTETNTDFEGFISAATKSHHNCFPDNELSIRYSVSGDSAIVKVGCSSGMGPWMNYECITAIYTTSSMSDLRSLLEAPRWNPEELI